MLFACKVYRERVFAYLKTFLDSDLGDLVEQHAVLTVIWRGDKQHRSAYSNRHKSCHTVAVNDMPLAKSHPSEMN